MSTFKKAIIFTVVMAAALTIVFLVHVGFAALGLWAASMVSTFEFGLWHVLFFAACLTILSVKESSVSFNDIKDAFNKYGEQPEEIPEKDEYCMETSNEAYIEYTNLLDKLHKEYCSMELENKVMKSIVEEKKRETADQSNYSNVNSLSEGYAPENRQEERAGVSLDKMKYAIPGYPLSEEYEEDIMPPRFYENQ